MTVLGPRAIRTPHSQYKLYKKIIMEISTYIHSLMNDPLPSVNVAKQPARNLEVEQLCLSSHSYSYTALEYM